jgi:hypothetical protein
MAKRTARERITTSVPRRMICQLKLKRESG